MQGWKHWGASHFTVKKCDVDYEEDALHWIDNVATALLTNVGSVPAITAAAAAEEKSPPVRNIITVSS